MNRRGVGPQRTRRSVPGQCVAAVATLALTLAAAQTRAAAPPPKEIAAGNRLYDAGQYDEATQRYGELLVDNPDSPVVRFNMAAAQYKAGKFGDAIATLQKADAGDDGALAARVAYNLGNALFRLGEQAAASEPQTALASYEQALTAYKRAMGADPTYVDPKFNHEFVAAKLDELKKKIEEEAKRQQDEQQQQEPQEQEQQQSREPPPQSNDEQQNAESPQERQPDSREAPESESPAQQPESANDNPPATDEERGAAPSQEPDAQPAPGDGQPAGGAATAEASPEGPETADRRQAQAIIDLGRDDELRPDEVQRHIGTALVGEPREDW